MTADGQPRVVRVLPDVPAIDKTFDYSVPDALAPGVRVGTIVRIELHGRRVGGWVVADHVAPPPGVRLKALAKVTGWGPPLDLIDLAGWAAWRWAGRPASFLTTASPHRAVLGLPRGHRGEAATRFVGASSPYGDMIDAAFGSGADGSVVRLPPAADLYPVALAAAGRGDALIVAPAVATARHIGLRLRRAGVHVALMPNEWPVARAGGSVVVGSRAAVWAPVPDLATVVVFDEHDEAYQEERTPTWHARDIAIERARRAGVPCVLVSPAPSLEALTWVDPARVLVPGRSMEREGWSIVDVVDRRDEEPGRAGLYSDKLVRVLRGSDRIVCVLNRKGRARLLVCASCGATTRCERCDAAVVLTPDRALRCSRCESERPSVCQSCGGTTLKNLRAGVTRVREELEALANEAVHELSGDGDDARTAEARIVVGTEAVLHHDIDAQVVAFLDFDQELLAPRYRAAEQALHLIVRGMRLLARSRSTRPDSIGGRAGLGRVLIQTRLPHHEVIQAALHADPTRVAHAEQARRELLRFPPTTALAVVSGASAEAYISGLHGQPDLEVMGPSDGRWLVRAADHDVLADGLAAVPRPPGRLRVEVDPMRI